MDSVFENIVQKNIDSTLNFTMHREMHVQSFR